MTHDRVSHGIVARDAVFDGGIDVGVLGALAPLGCVSLRYYERCSCVDEATCPLRDTMLDDYVARAVRSMEALP